tara:strand:- start:199 stop:1044 length:846 start_codon:yes stop_codon:yes gene_type:complete
MKILIIGNFHHKNKYGLEQILKHLNYEYKFGLLNEIHNYDLIISPALQINTVKYPNKKFIFGPHFSVFPNKMLLDINNNNNNCIYIQPSKWSFDVWNNLGVQNILPLKIFCFPVDTIIFCQKSIIERNKVFIYFKRRKKEELNIITSFLKNKNIEYKIFDYVKTYKEEDYLNYLQNSKYGIVLGAHESQGFAIEEALSCNVPLLVWNVSSMAQEEGINYHPVPATTIPYWDQRCGEYFYNTKEFESKYNEFISKLDTYKPREFILENLNVEKCAENFEKLI